MSTRADPTLSRPVIALLALACGVSVSTIYFPQAIVSLVATDLHVDATDATLVPTAAQLGYAAGLFLLVPLGDRVANRTLVAVLLLLTAAGLVAAGLAPTLPLLIICSALVGFTTVVPQVLLPMAAGSAPPQRRAAVTGTLLSGLLAGILLARTFGGVLGGWLGWRAPYLCAAAAVALLAIGLRAALPRIVPPSRQTYRALLATALTLLRSEPQLRTSCFNQALLFGAFSAAWTCLALLVTGPTYAAGPQLIGVIALVGAASVFVTPLVGRRVDRSGPGPVNITCAALAIAAAAVLALATIGATPGLLALAGGMLLLDVAVQSGQVANQSRIFALRPDLRARLNTAYMTCSFLGASAGTWLGVRAYELGGWLAVCGLLAIAAAAVLVRSRWSGAATRECDRGCTSRTA